MLQGPAARSDKSEWDIEGTVTKFYRSHGWVTLHIQPDAHHIPKGWPDHLLLGPEGRTVFIEFKKPGEEPTPIQVHTHAQLRKLGHTVLLCDSFEQAVGPLLEEREQ